jgi:uncharacterized delta-60 repeat protein
VCKARHILAAFLGVVAGCSSGSNGSSTSDASNDSSMTVSDSAPPLESGPVDGPIAEASAEAGPVIDGATPDAGTSDVIEAAVGPSGQLDPSFGSGGTVSTDFYKSTDLVNAMVVQGDGKIVAAGEVYEPLDGSGAYHAAVARYDMHGSLETSFGVSGVYLAGAAFAYSAASAVALQSTGSIVVGGRAARAVDGGTQSFAFLTRLGAAGALDASFAGGGTASLDFGAAGSVDLAGIAVAADDSLVVVGDYNKNATAPFDYDIYIARFNADGTPVNGFGTGGVLTMDLGTPYDHLVGVALRSDGRILVGGQTSNSTVVLQFSAQGAPDATFGSSGRTDFPATGRTDIRGFALDPTSGAAYLVGDTAAPFDSGSVFVGIAQRFTQQGAIDMSFGTAGAAIVPLGGGEPSFSSVLVDNGGGVICGGDYGATTSDGGVLDQWGLVRLDAHGALVPTFGSGGISVSAFPNGAYDLSSLAWERDGTIVAAGSIDGATTFEDFSVGDYFR